MVGEKQQMPQVLDFQIARFNFLRLLKRTKISEVKRSDSSFCPSSSPFSTLSYLTSLRLVYLKKRHSTDEKKPRFQNQANVRRCIERLNGTRSWHHITGYGGTQSIAADACACR